MPVINLGKRKQRERTVNKELYQDIYQDPRWRKLRAAKIAENPLCEICEKKGKTVLTQEVHHIRPFQTGATPAEVEILAFDLDNLQSLCTPCHKTEDQEIRQIIREGTPVKLFNSFSTKKIVENKAPLSL
jgi:5-methylcytosine-specific restriction protein A